MLGRHVILIISLYVINMSRRCMKINEEVTTWGASHKR